jgi:hypothetical protein
MILPDVLLAAPKFYRLCRYRWLNFYQLPVQIVSRLSRSSTAEEAKIYSEQNFLSCAKWLKSAAFCIYCEFFGINLFSKEALSQVLD